MLNDTDVEKILVSKLKIKSRKLEFEIFIHRYYGMASLGLVIISIGIAAMETLPNLNAHFKVSN